MGHKSTEGLGVAAMMRAMRVFGRSMVTFYDELFLLVGLNLVWFVITAVLAVGAGYVLVPLTILSPVRVFSPVALLPPLAALILFNPLSAGLFYIAHELANERRVYFSYLWEGTRTYLLQSLKISLFNAALLLLLLVNFEFYLRMDSPLVKFTSILWLYGVFLWASVQIYLFPLLMEQTNKSVLLIFKNAFILVMSDPLFSLTLMVLLVVLTVASLLILALGVLFLGSLVSLITCKALATRLEAIRVMREGRED